MLRTTTITGTDERGFPATATVEVTEPDQPTATDGATDGPLMVVGTTVPLADFGHLTGDGRDAGSRFCRTFSSPGDGILPWGQGRRAVPDDVAEFHSFKDWSSDSAAVTAVTTMLDAMPAELWEDAPLLPELSIYDPDGYSDGRDDCDGISFLVTYFHEGERNFIEAGLPAAEWRRRHRLIYKTIRQHPRGHRVAYVPVQTLTWTDAMSTPTSSKGDRDPVAWWAGVGDYAGWDCYVSSVTDKPPAPGLYPDPARFLTLPLQGARATGRQLFVPELGVIRQGAPAETGLFRAVWIAETVSYLADQGCAGVAWWDALGANSRDFRLTDADSRQAWQDVLAGQF